MWTVNGWRLSSLTGALSGLWFVRTYFVSLLVNQHSLAVHFGFYYKFALPHRIGHTEARDALGKLRKKRGEQRQVFVWSDVGVIQSLQHSPQICAVVVGPHCVRVHIVEDTVVLQANLHIFQDDANQPFLLSAAAIANHARQPLLARSVVLGFTECIEAQVDISYRPLPSVTFGQLYRQMCDHDTGELMPTGTCPMANQPQEPYH